VLAFLIAITVASRLDEPFGRSAQFMTPVVRWGAARPSGWGKIPGPRARKTPSTTPARSACVKGVGRTRRVACRRADPRAKPGESRAEVARACERLRAAGADRRRPLRDARETRPSRRVREQPRRRCGGGRDPAFRRRQSALGIGETSYSNAGAAQLGASGGGAARGSLTSKSKTGELESRVTGRASTRTRIDPVDEKALMRASVIAAAGAQIRSLEVFLLPVAHGPRRGSFHAPTHAMYDLFVARGGSDRPQ